MITEVSIFPSYSGLPQVFKLPVVSGGMDR